MMKKVQVEVCVCTACVMNGSMSIIDSVESLRDLKEQIQYEYMTDDVTGVIEIATNKCLGGNVHSEESPVVSVNGRIFNKADDESVMSYVIDLFKEK